MKRFACFAMLPVACLLLLAFYITDDPIQQLRERFGSFQAKYPLEKVYVQFDRDDYAEKDTIYFKAYIINSEGNQQPVVSNILHIDIAGDDNTIVKTLQYPASKGQAWGVIAVADCMKKGSWKLRAYTNWMRNFDQGYFFRKTIQIGASPISNALQPDAATAEVNFYPEGGQLVNGLHSRIAFSAVAADGRGIAVSGSISDQTGKIITSIQSAANGLGSFQLTPAAGVGYTATLRSTDGKEKKTALLKTQAQGYGLAVTNDDDGNLSVKISASQALVNKPVILVLQAANKIQYSSRVNVSAKGVESSLSTARFPSGILQLVLFDTSLYPVAERLVYIDHEDHLRLKIATDKAVYAKREQVNLSVEINDETAAPVDGSFSMSVSEVPATANETSSPNIFSQLLLAADTKMRMEQAADYFAATTEQQRNDLDNLLMTLHWNRFSWKDVLAGNDAAPAFQPEESLQISGKILSPTGAPVKGAAVTLTIKEGDLITHTVSEQNGLFKFDKLYCSDSSAITIYAKDPEGKSKLTIVLDSLPLQQPYYKETTGDLSPTDTLFAPGLRRPLQGFAPVAVSKSARPGAKLLKEVIVTERKVTLKELATRGSMNLNGPGNADQVLTFKDLELCHELANCLFGKLVGVELIKVKERLFAYSNRRLGVKGRMLVVKDGMPLGDESADLNMINVYDIASIEVLRSGAHLNVYGPPGVNGVLVITTKSGQVDYSGKPATDNVSSAANGMLYGYHPGQEFYLPNYANSKTSPAIADKRSTVFWLPNIGTDENGKASMQFFNSDKTGKFKVVLEGLSADGKPGRQVFYYEVK